MSHRDAYLSEKAEQDAEMEADRKADEKYEREKLNSPSAYFEWFMTEFKTPTTQTCQNYGGENGSASVPR
jgi:hypothetical protein